MIPSRNSEGSPGSKRSRPPSRKRQERKRIAKRQANELIEIALREHSRDPELAKRHAEIAWRLCTKFNVRMGKRRLLFCHHCKQFIVPPSDARYRLSNRRDGINVTCLKCGRIYRKIFSKAK